DTITFTPTTTRYLRMQGITRGTPYGYSLYSFTVQSPGDLALNHIASASSTETPALSASLAFDGKPATRWSSAYNNNESIQVDLGTAQSVGSVALTWEAAYGRDYDIQASTNGTDWTTTLFQRRGHVGAGTDTITFTPTTTRYLRMQGITRGTPYGYSLYSFQVYSGAPQRVAAWTAGLGGGGQSFTNQTIRMVAHSTVAGSQVRVRLSNLYGTTPLNIGAVDVALQSSGGTAVAGSHQSVKFAGAATATIPTGGDLTSDPIPMSVNADQDLLVSVYLPNATGPSTLHLEAWDTTYISSPGNHVSDDATVNYPTTSSSWFDLAGLDVLSPTAAGTVVAIGDSITDGSHSTSGANRRWPDDLARRLNANGLTTRGVVDAGIGGNKVLTDGTSNPSLLNRFAHDALGQPGVKEIILLEGINDIGNGPPSAQQIITGYQTVIGQAHAQGVKIYGGTILPDQGSGYYSPPKESVRAAVNDWIRTSGAYDAVIDFDAVMRDSSNPLALNPLYDSGDHLHPNDAGYQAMANAVDLNLLSP
ncbi:GDSL-type esterase/lipase family protein, partial [Kitasatospora sp. NPDC057015]|uniref:GDSL-type esterase/lipase family protein n=1 Tax=Kitasatospora sp. NPDC057015 TaxID=3346001 RepID=UPI0036320C3A